MRPPTIQNLAASRCAWFREASNGCAERTNRMIKSIVLTVPPSTPSSLQGGPPQNHRDLIDAEIAYHLVVRGKGAIRPFPPSIPIRCSRSHTHS